MNDNPTDDDDNEEEEVHQFNPNTVYEWTEDPNTPFSQRGQPLSPSRFATPQNQDFWTRRVTAAVPEMISPPLPDRSQYQPASMMAPYDEFDAPDPRAEIDDHPRRKGETHEQYKQRVIAAREKLGIMSKPYPLDLHEIPLDWQFPGKQSDKRRKYRNTQEFRHRRMMDPNNKYFDQGYRDRWYAQKRQRQEHNAGIDGFLLYNVRKWQEKNGLPREPTPDPAEDSGDGYYNNEFEKTVGDPKNLRCRECLIIGYPCTLVTQEGSARPCDYCSKQGYKCEQFLPTTKVRGAPHKVGMPYVVRERPSRARPQLGQAPNNPNLPFVQNQLYRERSPLGKRRRGRPPKGTRTETESDVPHRRRSRSPLVDRPTDMGGVERPFDGSEIESYTHTHESHLEEINVPQGIRNVMDSGWRVETGRECHACHHSGLNCDKKPCNNCRLFNIQCLDLLLPGSGLESQILQTTQPFYSQEDIYSNVVLGLQDLREQVNTQEFSERLPSTTTSIPGQVNPFAPVPPSSIDSEEYFGMDLLDPALNSSEIVSENPKGIEVLTSQQFKNPLQEYLNAQTQGGSQYQANPESFPIIPPITTRDLDVKSSRDRLVEAAASLSMPEGAPAQPAGQPDWQYTSKGLIRHNGYMLIDFYANANKDSKPMKPTDFLIPYQKWNPNTVRRPVSYDSEIPCSQNRYFSDMYGPNGPLPFTRCGEIPSCKCELLDHSTSETDGHICNTCHRIQGNVEVGVRSDTNTEGRAYLCEDCAFNCVGDEDIIKTGDCVCGETMRLNHLCHEHFTTGWLEISIRATTTTDWLTRAGQMNCLACSAKPQDPTSGVWVCKACHSVVKDNQHNAVYFSGVEGRPGR